MNTIQRAVVIRAYGGADAAQVAEIEKPTPGQGQVLVRVRAAGVNGIDWKVREGHVRNAFPLSLPIVLGAEMAGVIDAVGPGASRFSVGDRVMGAMGGLGAYAEFVAVSEASLSPTPEALDDVQAAAMPVAAVAAWNSLHHAGPIFAGQRVLIHGAAGGLGAYAVQYAKRAGAEVIATAGTADLNYVRSLGADEVIDYQSQRFENLVRNIDLVLDYVGGEVLDRSWQVLAQNGVVVGTSSPDILARTPANRRSLWFMNKPDPQLLETLAREVASGTLQSRIGDVVGFSDIPKAIERNRTVSRTGKVVADFTY
ncbi:NADP-dependent oxidoreductase [Pseudomonas cichorii]|uniref:NADP-dependent oxidoreductase n=1 Tax=Pseudomonas lijiangensis TaxID=2995658 RepID=A0ABX8HPX7_9PSED|nr:MULTISPECIES: NADP-dependent oxidoreductase [Pseudomonas syringae group]MBX8489602.1 NADP-dependent oxidoreductase [Pseudomonas cichorii]MBX8500219.1 NADP-dependent oxidoreductase [Pseudomonas lijiangensis]MBX8505471.1 NADP-dependent oxidoreductase [Pseudomonas lijiangensis]MBX8509365.1 NADP-dependent oxidoreductase [Pseudomonas cichorii]MBX8521702.1 NADP-dependent oxidoreductase [Pseudomonas cichorii]